MDPNPLVRKLDGYALLGPEDRDTIRALAEERVETFAAKADIISDGETPDFIHLILEGWAARYKIMPDGSRQITAFLIPGDFCDLHVTVLAQMDHGIAAITRCKVANLDPVKLDRITSERTMLTKSIWWMTLVDEAVLRQWVINSRRKALASLAHLLCELHVRLKAVGLVRDDRMELPLTQEELAEATGMTTVHLNRMLQSLREQGLITLRARRLIILDVAGLAQEAGFDDSYLHLRKERRRRGEAPAG